MNRQSSRVRHYGLLIIILLVGLGLRFWNLALKPLWLDEVLTALFTMGRNLSDVPLDRFFPLTALDRLFTVQPGVSCAQIARTIATQSVHPPLFFCSMAAWLQGLRPIGESWVGAMRSLAAIWGVGAIAALYLLNRLAFSPRVGLVGAALMAVSPFAVYLSQEARHYTLPMLFITLSLAALVEIQKDMLKGGRSRLPIWLSWIVLNSVGFYVHYFFLLAFVAQVIALCAWMFLRARQLQLPWRSLHYSWIALGLAIAAIISSYLPWLPTLLGHLDRPEIDWLIPYNPDWLDRIAPLYQSIVGWVLMVIALPTENQPRLVRNSVAIVILVFVLWLIPQLVRGVKQVWRIQAHRPAFFLMSGFLLCILAEFAGIVYILDKDITVVPRYNFVYYPAFCALLGACLADERQQAKPVSKSFLASFTAVRSTPIFSPLIAILMVGLISSLLVVHNFVFQKSYEPDRVAQTFAAEANQPVLVVMTYRSLQEVALGLSFALELKKLYPANQLDSQVQYAFLDRSQGYATVWQKLRELPQPLPVPLNLWVVGTPGMRSRDYPNRLRINVGDRSKRAICRIDAEKFDRVGFPYQMYRCDIRRTNT